jgi:hypothetical protein
MDPQDVLVIALDGMTHGVTTRTAITINTQVGTTGPIDTVDPADPENIITVIGRTGYAIQSAQGTRFTASCGLSFDAANAALDGDSRFAQGAAVDCPNC